MADLAFDLVGNWTSARILVRLLVVIESPWTPLREGFIHRDTRERVQLAMAPPQADALEAFATGVDPVTPSIDDALLQEIAHHKAVVQVSSTPDGASPLTTALTLARAADAIVNAGALAVWCRTSGLAHGADGFQWLVAQADAAADGDGELDLAEALFPLFVRYALGVPRACTVGMAALGVPDIVLGKPLDPDRAVAKLEARALGVLRGSVPPVVPDDRGLGMFGNAVGIVVV